jgi:small-conductance mechanosensitive channel
MNSFSTFLQDPVFLRFVSLAVSLGMIYIVVRFLQRGTSKYVTNNNTRYQVRKFISFAGYIIAFIAIMLIFNYRLSNLTLAVRVAGAGIAFALQEVIVSVAGFLAILFGNFYKVGDRVQLGGIKGDVVDYKKRRATKDILSERILDIIIQNDDKIQVASAAMKITAFPQQNLQKD